MLALITGGTSGIGLEIAKILNDKGYKLILVGSRSEFSVQDFNDATYIQCNLSKEEEVYSLISKIRDNDFDIFINNAGFGDIGCFLNTDDKKEMDMIEVNVKAMHILLKYFMKKMHGNKKGKILVTSSLAAYSSSGYMATYYATKVYSFHLALGYYRELKDLKSKVSLSILCPGPVATGFEKTANVKFNIKPIPAKKVAKIAVKKMMKGKTIIIPTFKFKFMAFASRFAPTLFTNKVVSKSARRRKSK